MSNEAFTLFLTDYGPGILIILVMIVLSAFFSGSETALTAASRSRMHTLEANGDERAGMVNRLIERRDRLIGALLIGNNLANILSSSIATSLFLHFFGASGVAYATLAMTIILVIFAEVLPKSWAIASPDRFCAWRGTHGQCHRSGGRPGFEPGQLDRAPHSRPVRHQSVFGNADVDGA